jgi:hypothetical protein
MTASSEFMKEDQNEESNGQESDFNDEVGDDNKTETVLNEKTLPMYRDVKDSFEPLERLLGVL